LEEKKFVRNISEWSQQIRAVLSKSHDLMVYVEEVGDANVQKEVSRLAQLIVDVELGLTLLMQVAPSDSATSVSALLLGYRFRVTALSNDENWRLVQVARFYLFRRKGKQWERCLNEYIKLPEILRIFRLAEVGDVPKLIPSSTYPQRLQVYRQTLLATPPHKKHEVKLATAGYWYAKSHKNHTTVEVPINIPEAVAKSAPSPLVKLHRTRSSGNPSHCFTWNQLLAVAQEMDEKLKQAGHEKENYYGRLQGIAIKIYDASIDDFRLEDPDAEINLEQLVHIVGLLNVGKSTLLEVLIYNFASQGYRCALLVNDVAAAVRLAWLFRSGLDVLAAPVLGSSNRSEHLSKVYESILMTEGEEIEQGAVHSAWRWFSPVCPLLALVQSEDKWDFGEEPCHHLYKQAVTTQKDNSNSTTNIDDDEELDDFEYDGNKYTCPLYYRCPRHQLEQDLATAMVWILTPASFIHTRVPKQVFAERLTFAEAVYRECNFLFVDEADRVQVQFDEAGAPDEVLVDASGNSLLNKLGLKFANAIYNSDRRNMSAELVAVAKRANDYAQIAADLILPKLYNQPKLVEWIGHNPFTGRSLFAHIIRDILEPLEDNEPLPKQKLAQRKQKGNQIESLSAEQARQRRKKIMQPLEKFLQAPLNQKQGGELSDLALNILSTDSDARALTNVADWVRKWLASEEIPMLNKTNFEELTHHVHLAILVTVLNDRLGFLVDNLNALLRVKVLDMHDTSLSLVYRPPRDYLPVVPSSPVGNILGFRYTRGRGYTGGKLEYFRYVGVGRYLLLNFPKLYAVDNWDGPHTILISGTSYAPGTPAYHIRERPTILLELASHNNTAGDAGIGESVFHFSPKRNVAGKPIALSGLPPAARKKAVDEMVKAIARGDKQTKSFLTDLFDTLKELQQQDPKRWNDRQRLLIITNSYDEAELVVSILKPLYRVENIEGIVTLRRDNAPSGLDGLRRSEARNVAKLPIQIVVAPLMALERGHNMLNEDRIAAFGAAIFLSRPMPVPDDWQTTVRQLNDWALQNFASASFSDMNLTSVEQEFYHNAVLKMLDLNCRAMSFKQLTPDERSVLCWSQLVSIWQIIGRLVRGGVPCIVHFLDAKFAPLSAKGEVDSEVTSLLVAIIKELEFAIEASGKGAWERTIARSLYGAFFNALNRMMLV
jgi:pPIWI RE three-gene island domain Z